MRTERRWYGVVMCVWALVGAPMVATAQEGETLPATGDEAVQVSPELLLPSNADAKRFHAVRLGVDGNLPGRVSYLDVGGIHVPVQATVTFSQDGQVLSTARANLEGRFQAVGLKPGVYNVIADAGAYFGAFSIEVQQYDIAADPERSNLDLTLVPIESIPGHEMVGQPFPALPLEAYPDGMLRWRWRRWRRRSCRSCRTGRSRRSSRYWWWWRIWRFETRKSLRAVGAHLGRHLSCVPPGRGSL